MKTSVRNILKSRVTQASLLLALIATVAAFGWPNKDEGRVKLGGTWVGRYGDITWTGTYSPDASGQNATYALQWMTMNAQFEALLASVGAQTMSIACGSMSMISRDTAAGKMIWYVLAEGTPSTTAPVAGEIKAIAVMTSEWHFTSPNTAEGTHNLKMYSPDAQGSMVPADDAVPFLDVTYQKVPHLKVR